MNEDKVLEEVNVLVFGDVFKDVYTKVTSTRFSPENNSAPVYDVIERSATLGGAGYVAENIASLSEKIKVDLLGCTSHDDCNSMLYKSLGQHKFLDVKPCHYFGKEIVKERIILSPYNTQLCRIDDRLRFSDEEIAGVNFKLQRMVKIGKRYSGVVMSDDWKGIVNEESMALIRKLNYGFTVVDSKRVDLSIFRGLNVLKINKQEYSNQVSFAPYVNVAELFDHCIVTSAAENTKLMICEKIKSGPRKYITHIEEFVVEKSNNVVDVSGCGDVHTAALAVKLTETSDIREAIKFANKAASKKVQLLGTIPLFRRDVDL